MRTHDIVRSPRGHAYLNLGAGASWSREWTNLDLHSGEHVRRHDLRKPLPFTDCVFDAAYSSHVLEHLTPEEGGRLLGEAHRVLRPGGVVRIVVPDLERLCSDYLEQLGVAAADPSERALRRYRWMQIELLDQMVRTRSGGEMLRMLKRDDLDREFIRARIGDEVLALGESAEGGVVRRVRARLSPPREIGPRLLGALRLRVLPPQMTGEAHKWMYDRLSLRLALEEAGFRGFEVMTFELSRIVDWHRYRLDHEVRRRMPRKPDSIYVEAVRPAEEP